MPKKQKKQKKTHTTLSLGHCISQNSFESDGEVSIMAFSLTSSNAGSGS
jgi:hypothetical protein